MNFVPRTVSQSKPLNWLLFGYFVAAMRKVTNMESFYVVMTHYVVFRMLRGFTHAKNGFSLNLQKVKMGYQEGEWFELDKYCLNQPKGSRMERQAEKVSLHQLEWLPTQSKAFKGLISHSFIIIESLWWAKDLDTTEDQRGP